MSAPKSNAARAIIAFVFAFFVLIGTPPSFLETISNLSTAALVLLLGILMFFVFIEAGGVQHFKSKVVKEIEHEGKPLKISEHESRKLFTKSGRMFLIAGVIIAAVLIFIGAGGLGGVGLAIPVVPLGAVFLAMIILAIVWLVVGG